MSCLDRRFSEDLLPKAWGGLLILVGQKSEGHEEINVNYMQIYL